MNAQPLSFAGYEVITLLDGIFEAPADIIVHERGEAARTAAIARLGQEKIRIDVNCFALHGAGGITLVDAGTGKAWGPALGHARAAMADAGIARQDVGRILITHLHGDHALGLFDGEEPWFPTAEIIVPEADLRFYGDETHRAAVPENKRGAFDIAAKLQRLYAGRVRSAAPGPVLPEIELIPLPGHSFGHSGYLIGDEERALLLWGDALHLADQQAEDPETGILYDLDAAQAVASRRDILARAADAGWVVSGGHVTGFRKVRRQGSGFALEPAA
ncbi:MBL fold metallo-hydrolase [Bosea sp. BH3]|uniref:AidB family quorum-quenching N-acyl homoserine lactonase n=1 Tax=Bosea sp. BH3 TaxID=2871701 RepID=UPI0021CAFC92|nr:MBL fold metallo-hydrolase [Bosea sp. BH3]MCU4180743.1 MBL fold metallo-hydrolase [Bosea sp. BH3]